jgi:2-polyprenyl-3-methyl-5-hydroxy-6-metoxy-1,4-benzoquinol methylase
VIYINPLPDANDYFKMYPPEYQSGVNRTILKNQYKKLPGLRFSYGFQFDLIKKYATHDPKILDYGCGNANFLINALDKDFICDGAEFNEKHVEILKEEIPSCNFYTITDFLKDSTVKYDVIRLSNVLEHMDNPSEIIRLLINRLANNGILLIEGPLECNFNFAYLTRKVYFLLMNKIRNGYIANHAPTHITFTNYKNQLSFFNKLGLKTLEYKINEAAWPYPASFAEALGLGGKVKVIIARFSILFSGFSKEWGNTFIYVGRKEQEN